MDMEVSGLRLSQARVYSAAEGTSGKGGAVETAEAVSKDTDAATFEADGGVSGRGSSVTVYKMDVETVRQLKSESEQRMAW